MQFPAVVREVGGRLRKEKVVELMDPIQNKPIITIPYNTYQAIKQWFADGFPLIEDHVIKPNAVINYLEESNPILLETEIQIEKNKERRRVRNTFINILQWISVVAMLIIVAAIAFAIIQNAGGNVAQAVHNVVPSGPPINIK